MLTTKQREQLRIDVAEALTRSTLKHFIRLVETHAGRELGSDEDNIRKFARNRSNANDADLAVIHSFLYTTPIGRQLLGDKDGSPTAISNLLIALQSGATASPDAHHLSGVFLAYHGSYMYPAHYVVRALVFDHLGHGMIAVTDYLRNERAPIETEITATGAVLFRNERAQILLLRSDNAVGFNLISCDHVVAQEKPVKGVFLTGLMYGVNDHNQNFARPVYMRHKPGTIADLLPMTGIRALSQIDKFPDDKEPLRRLLKVDPRFCLPDPLQGISIK